MSVYMYINICSEKVFLYASIHIHTVATVPDCTLYLSKSAVLERDKKNFYYIFEKIVSFCHLILSLQYA